MQGQQACRALHVCLRCADYRCAETACGCVDRMLIRGGARALATRGPAARTGAGRSRVLTATQGMHAEMSGWRPAVRVGRTGWCKACTTLSRVNGALRIALVLASQRL